MTRQRHLLLAATLAVPALSYAAEAEGSRLGGSRREPDEWVPIEDLVEPDEALEQGQPALALPLPPEPVQPDTAARPFTWRSTRAGTGSCSSCWSTTPK